jgi:polygalacturonase
MADDKKKKKPAKPKAPAKVALMVGLGLDNQDGHTRVTTGKNFRLVGGSKDTHEVMQETAVKVNEELDRRHVRLEDVSPEQFAEILHKSKP